MFFDDFLQIKHFIVQALNPGLDRGDKMTSSMTSSTTSLNKPGRRVIGHRSKYNTGQGGSWGIEVSTIHGLVGS